MASQRYQNCSEHLKFVAVLMLMLTFTCSHQCVEQCIGISSNALMTSLSQKTDEACWLRVNQDGRVVTVGLTRDHKPEVEKECDAVRLRHSIPQQGGLSGAAHSDSSCVSVFQGL